MRTKTLLLACAALALGLATSQAQVYSQNVVGYANVVLPGNGYALVANPFDDGNGNHLTNIIAALPGRSAIVTFTPGLGGGPVTINRNAGGTAWSADVQFPPGTGFFVRNGLLPSPGFAAAPTVTNTFVGTVAFSSGSFSVTNDIPAGYSLQGSRFRMLAILPIGGDGESANGDANMNYGGAVHSIGTGVGLTKILTWDPVAKGVKCQ